MVRKSVKRKDIYRDDLKDLVGGSSVRQWKVQNILTLSPLVSRNAFNEIRDDEDDDDEWNQAPLVMGFTSFAWMSPAMYRSKRSEKERPCGATPRDRIIYKP